MPPAHRGPGGGAKARQAERGRGIGAGPAQRPGRPALCGAARHRGSGPPDSLVSGPCPSPWADARRERCERRPLSAWRRSLRAFLSARPVSGASFAPPRVPFAPLRATLLAAGASREEDVMLRVCRRGAVAGARELMLEEDRALREAFGRFSVPAARAAGTAVVQRYQHAGAGHWFACSCLGPGVRPPVLVPVAEAHIRRHQDPPWPAHAEECDFHRDPDEQRLVAASYARPRRGDLVRLVGKLRAGEPPALMELRGRSYARGRGALATLLACSPPARSRASSGSCRGTACACRPRKRSPTRPGVRRWAMRCACAPPTTPPTPAAGLRAT